MKKLTATGVKKLVIAVIVLVGLLVGADFATAAIAEYKVSRELSSELTLEEDPSVRINGFPFITQAVGGTYRHIDMRASGLQVGRLHNVAIEASMYGVHAPLSDVLEGSLNAVRIRNVEGRVRIRDIDLGRAIGINDLRIAPASDEEIDEVYGSRPLPENQEVIRMTGTTDIGGTMTEVIVIGRLELVAGQILVKPENFQVLNEHLDQETDVPDMINETLVNAFTTTVDPGGLPFTVTPTDVQVENGALVVEGTAENVRLADIRIERG